DEATVADAFGLGVIGRLPSAGARRDRQRTEALDALAARLRFVAPREKAQVVMVAPAAPYSDEDLALELGGAFAAFESSVIVLGADFGRGASGGGGAETGLAAVLLGQRTLEEELVQMVDTAGGYEADSACELLPAGDGARRPMAMLAGAAMRALVA